MTSCFSRLLVALLVATSAASAQAQTREKPTAAPPSAGVANPFDKFRSFSATLNGGLAADHDRKIYRSGELLRADFDGSYRITDVQKQTMWGVQGDRCSQFAMPDAGAYPFSAYHDFKVERSMTPEKETVDGHLCAVESVTFTAPEGLHTVIRMKLWEAEDLDGFPVRIEAEANGHKMDINYTSVSLKTPDPKLFHRPTRCQVGPQLGQKDTIKLEKDATKPKSPQEPAQH